MAIKEVDDGLDALRREIGVAEIMSLIERTARWVDPETFRLLPVWFPEHARRQPFYKGGWSEPQLNRSRSNGSVVHKVEGNVYANQALTLALGLRKANRPNWSCCHIWGVDDGTYQKSNAVVQDRRFYSCVANMVLLPTPLKAFTDTMPEVKAMLRLCAANLYSWECDHEALAAAGPSALGLAITDDYPASWPKRLGEGSPMGMVALTPEIRKLVEKRLAAIRQDMANPGPHYPVDEVRAVLHYWNIAL